MIVNDFRYKPKHGAPRRARTLDNRSEDDCDIHFTMGAYKGKKRRNALIENAFYCQSLTILL